MKKWLAAIVAIAAFTAIAVLVMPVRAQAAYETIYGPITDGADGFQYSEGSCSGANPLWIDTYYGWKCPATRGRVILKYCEWNPWAHVYEVRGFTAYAEIHWGAPGTPSQGLKWANRTTGWANWGIVDRRPEAQAYCIWRIAIGAPEYW